MKSFLKRRKSNINEEPHADRPREYIPALPVSIRSKHSNDALGGPTPTRFSGAGWEEFLTNISVPQPPLTPLSQSPSTSMARLTASGDSAANPVDDAFRSQLAPPFLSPNGSANRSPSPGRAAAPTFSNAHMMPPSSPALTNGLGSPLASPKTSTQGLYTADSRFPLGIASAPPGPMHGPFSAANRSSDSFLPPPRQPVAPSSPGSTRSPLSGPPSPLPPSEAQSRGPTHPTPGSTSGHSVRAASRSRAKTDADQSDAVSVKSNVSSSSNKGRSIGRFFRRKKQNSNDWPESDVPAIPKLPNQQKLNGHGSSTLTQGNRAKGEATADLLSPPASITSHRNSEAGSGALGGTLRKLSSPGRSYTDKEREWDDLMNGSSKDSANGPTRINAKGEVLYEGTGRSTLPREQNAKGTGTVPVAALPGSNNGQRSINTPPGTTESSAKASIEQSSRSHPSITSITSPVASSGAPARTPLPHSSSITEGQEPPMSPTLLLPTPGATLRSVSSQSSLRKLLEDMNLPFGDDSTPDVTVSTSEAGEKSKTAEAKELTNKPAQAAAFTNVTPAAPTVESTEVITTTEDADRSKRDSSEDDGTDSITALHQMLGNFAPLDFQTGFELQLTQYESDDKTVPSSAPPKPLRPAGAPPLFKSGSDTSLLGAGPQPERRGSATSMISSAQSEAYKTPPEEPGTPVVQPRDSMPGQGVAANGTTTPGQTSGSAPTTTTPGYSRATHNASLRRPMHAPPVVANGMAAAKRTQDPTSTRNSSASSSVPAIAPAPSSSGPNGLTISVRQGPPGAPALQPPSPKRMRVILPAPKARPEGAALADLIWTHTSIQFVQQLIGYLDFNDVKNLRQTSRAFRKALTSYPCKELILRRFLGQVGYRSWPRSKANGQPIPSPQPALADPIPLSFSDAEGFLLSHHLSTEYSLVAQAYARDPQGIDPMMLTLARATTRAYNRVLARLRAQPLFAIPPQRKGTVDSLMSPQGSANGNGADAEVLPSPWKPGRAALFQVWVPCGNGAWLTDEELTRCEAELFKAGIWNQLKRGDVVWDCALPDEGNLGRLIFDGQFLRDLSFTFDPIGHLPSWLNVFSFSPAHFHGRIRSSTNSPVMFMDMTPFREQVASTLHLVQDNAETVSPNGARYRVQRWVYHAKVKVTPGTIISNHGLECVHNDWSGTILIETEGTIEHARDLINRCFGPNSTQQSRLQLLQTINKGPLPPMSGEDKWSYSDKSEATSPFEIVRAKSKPGQLFVRPVVKAPQMI
ncbi:hypothetical protein A4X13_0g4475 [Tilletia indica]|uniref:F-box domain-containing protein n=1 Tax=Tilletia indica TaxID=43049 RepID=A0A177TGY4_9BASI|nr:hypothetical protein A4X13_0g4475 [Tilletia indica]